MDALARTIEERKVINVNRNLDGIYLRVKRDNEYQAVCLSDMTEQELEETLNAERGEWLKGAVIHLALTLKAVGDKFGIERVYDETD